MLLASGKNCSHALRILESAEKTKQDHLMLHIHHGFNIVHKNLLELDHLLLSKCFAKISNLGCIKFINFLSELQRNVVECLLCGLHKRFTLSISFSKGKGSHLQDIAGSLLLLVHLVHGCQS